MQTVTTELGTISLGDVLWLANSGESFGAVIDINPAHNGEALITVRRAVDGLVFTVFYNEGFQKSYYWKNRTETGKVRYAIVDGTEIVRMGTYEETITEAVDRNLALVKIVPVRNPVKG